MKRLISLCGLVVCCCCASWGQSRPAPKGCYWDTEMKGPGVRPTLVCPQSKTTTSTPIGAEKELCASEGNGQHRCVKYHLQRCWDGSIVDPSQFQFCPTQPSGQVAFPPQQQGIPIGNSISNSDDSPGPVVSPGSMSPSSALSDIMDSVNRKPGCDELLAYRDGPLMHDLDTAIEKKAIYSQGKLAAMDQAQDVLNLMNKEWYLGKTGAEIVIHVKLATDEVKAVLKMFVPEEGVVDGFLEGLAGRDLPQKLPQTFAEEYKPIVDSTDLSVGLIKTWNEEGAKKAVGDAGKEVAWTIGEELSPVVGMEHGLLTYVDNQDKMEQSEEIIQQQVGKLVHDARSWHAKEQAESAKMIYYEGMRDKITVYCSAPDNGLTIPKP